MHLIKFRRLATPAFQVRITNFLSPISQLAGDETFVFFGGNPVVKDFHFTELKGFSEQGAGEAIGEKKPELFPGGKF